MSTTLTLLGTSTPSCYLSRYLTVAIFEVGVKLFIICCLCYPLTLLPRQYGIDENSDTCLFCLNVLLGMPSLGLYVKESYRDNDGYQPLL